MHLYVNKIRHIKCSSLFYISIFIYCINTLIAETEFFVPALFAILNYFVYLILIGISILPELKGIRIKFIIFKIGIITLGGISAYLSGSSYFLVSLLFLLGSFNTDIRKTIRIILRCNIACILFVLLMTILGIIKTSISYKAISGVLRNSLGFNHVNVLSNHYILIMTCIVFLNYNRLKLKHYLGLLIILGVGYYYTRTNSLLVIGIAGLVIISLFKLSEKYSMNRWKYAVALSPIICAILSFGPISFFSEEMNNALNVVLSNRIAYIRIFYKEYGLSLLGQRISLISTQEAIFYHTAARVLDNAYLHIAIRYGIITLIALLTGYTMIGLSAIKEKNTQNLILVIFIISIWGIVETCYFRFDYNPFILLIAQIIQRKSSVQQPEYSGVAEAAA